MRIRISLAGTATAILLLSTAALAQFGARMPSMSGVLSPTVGDGAAYEMTSNRENKKQQMEVAITGKEEYQGKTGYWMEYSFVDPKQGPIASKMMISMTGDQSTTMRMVMRMGTEVVEMDMNMPMMQNSQKTSSTDIRQKAVRVGTESITVPAGTFSCEHWKMNDGTGDAWISEKVHPFGLVKSVSKDSTMVLVRQITDAKTKLPPPYKKFDMQEMMRQSQQHP